MKRIILLFTIGLMLISCSENDQKSVKDIDHGVYEMRVYYTYEGKFNDIISRFENHTIKLFDKHGFNNVGYWTTLKKDSLSFADKFIFQNDGKEALVYIVSFKDMDTRNESWRALLMILNGLVFLRKAGKMVQLLGKLNKYFFLLLFFQI